MSSHGSSSSSSSRFHHENKENDPPISGDTKRIPGMRSVVASSSGYSGIQKHHLIKLINTSGALYTTDLTKSNTHLVCWEFEGGKYAFARKHGINIVNHRWFEDCFKAGKMVPVDRYIMCSGKDVGPLTWRPPIVSVSKPIKTHMIVTNNDSAEAFDSSSTLQGSQSYLNTQSVGHSDKRTLQESSTSRSNQEISAAITSSNTSDEAPSSFPQERTIQRKKRRLLKKLPSGSDENLSKKDNDHLLPSYRNMVRGKRSRFGKIPMYFLPSSDDIEQSGLDQTGNNITINEQPVVENKEESIKSEAKPGIEFIRSSAKNKRSTKSSQPVNPGESSNTAGSSHSPNTSRSSHSSDTAIDISCAICWADSSSTRGALLCGHRFCFKCIKKWADEMVLKKKTPTCPLCSQHFDFVTIKNDADVHDQKIFSQSLPEFSEDNVYLVYGDKSKENLHCGVCGSMDTKELILKCGFCGKRAVHSFCLDPPLPPVNDNSWSCAYCTSIRRPAFDFL